MLFLAALSVRFVWLGLAKWAPSVLHLVQSTSGNTITVFLNLVFSSRPKHQRKYYHTIFQLGVQCEIAL